MLLTIQRRPTVKQTTFGRMELDGQWVCYTLEDVIRPLEEKIVGETAIPAGTYRITLEESPKFGPDTLTVNDVPGFTYIRIHSGNDDSQTKGCPLVGMEIREMDDDGGNLLRSRDALRKLKGLVVPRIKAGEDCRLFVTDP